MCHRRATFSLREDAAISLDVRGKTSSNRDFSHAISFDARRICQHACGHTVADKIPRRRDLSHLPRTLPRSPGKNERYAVQLVNKEAGIRWGERPKKVS